MKNTRRLMVLGLVLAMVASAAGIAQADILDKKDAEDAFNDLQQSVKDEGGPPLKRKEVEDAKADLGQISEDVAPLIDASKTLKDIDRVGKGVKYLLGILRPFPYVGPVARALQPEVKEVLRLEKSLRWKLLGLVKPAKNLQKVAGAGEKAMNSTLDKYFIYDERDKVEEWEFPGEYGIGGGMNYPCLKGELGNYKEYMVGDLETVNHYLREIRDPVTAFNTNYENVSKELREFEELFKPIGELSDDLSGVKNLSHQLLVVLNKKVGFTINPGDFPDYTVSTTIDFVPQEVYDKTIKHKFDFHIKIFGWPVDKSFTVEGSVKDVVHGAVDIEDKILQKTVDIVDDEIPNYPRDGKIDYTFDHSIDIKIDLGPFGSWDKEIGISFRVEFSVKDVLKGSVDIEKEILNKAVDNAFDYVWEVAPDYVKDVVDKDDVRDNVEDTVKEVLDDEINDAVDWIEDKAKELEISRDDIKSEIKDIIGSVIDQAADDIKDKADQLVKDAEKHWDIEVSVATVLDGEDAIEDKILSFIPEKYRRLVDLDKYIKEILDQVGTIDIEFSVKKVLEEGDKLEDKIMEGVAEELAWLMKAYGLEEAATKIKNLVKDGVDPLLDQFPTEEIFPGYKKVYTLIQNLYSPLKTLKSDLNQIIGENIPTVNRKYYEESDLESLSKGEYKGKCHKNFWD